ncbi:hypothetical protein CEUSTIGMA_g3475.t1 [Chlamydomonas eustigma]|uniref:Uncharacterized protein n=1 Tax=Chlamydomonas eustigma TaxID=1157962 RepID=A0A250WZI8_9CHLO|nr:hypothetical protein CEUSTIGMA_g3475.t1 [Chlamydomonas eustigma]|eukprot:GAX76032.1 hypothetical protein CEUSTIGMA_g3475.t1 [Chlamydomonas eustigma]
MHKSVAQPASLSGLRKSSPTALTTTRPIDEDDESQYPKSRGLVKTAKGSKSSTGREKVSGRNVDSDEDLFEPSKPSAFATGGSQRKGGLSGTTLSSNFSARGTPGFAQGGVVGSDSSYAGRGGTRTPMSEDHEDDELLAGLAPPTSEAAKPGKSSVTGTAAPAAPGKVGGSSRHPAGSSIAAVTNKSLDSLNRLLKDDLPPLPLLSSDKEDAGGSQAPKAGRRAGGPASSSTPPSLSPDRSPPRTERSSHSEGLGMSSSNTGMSSSNTAPARALQQNVSYTDEESTTMIKKSADVETGGVGATSRTGRRMGGIEELPVQPSAASSSKPVKNKDTSLEFSSELDMPGIGSPVVTPSVNSSIASGIGSGSGRRENASAVPLGMSPLGGTPIATSSTTDKSRYRASENIKFSDSFGDDPLLPDDSVTSTANRHGSAAAGMQEKSATKSAPSSAPGSGHVSTRSSRDPTPERTLRPAGKWSPDIGDDDNEESEVGGGYMPSFMSASTTRRSAPSNPFSSMSAPTRQTSGTPPALGMSIDTRRGDVEPSTQPPPPRQRRNIHGGDVDSTVAASITAGVQSGRVNPLLSVKGSGKPKTKDEEEREKTAAAMAAALQRRQELSAGAATSAPFRLPSEARAAPTSAPLKSQQTLKKSTIDFLDSSNDDDLDLPGLKQPEQKMMAVASSGAPGGSQLQHAPGRQQAAPSPLGRMDKFGSAGPTQQVSVSNISIPQQQQQMYAGKQSSPTGSSKSDSTAPQVAAPVPMVAAPVPMNHPNNVVTSTGKEASSMNAVHQFAFSDASRGLSATYPPPGVTSMPASNLSGWPLGVTPGTGLPPGVTPLSGPPPGITPLSGPPPGVTPLAGLPPGVVSLSGAPSTAPPGVTPYMPNLSQGVAVAASSAAGKVPTSAAVASFDTAAILHGIDTKVLTDRIATLHKDNESALEAVKSELKKAQEDIARLKTEVSDKDFALKEKEVKIRDAEGKAASLESKSKILVAESQVSGVAQSQVSVIAQSQVSVIAQSQVSVIAQSQVSGVAESQVSVIAQSEVSVIAQSEVSVIAQSQVSVIAQSQVSGVAQSQVSVIAQSQVSGVAESQALAVSEAAGMRAQIEDLKASLARVKKQYEDAEESRSKETDRLRVELEALRQSHADEVSRIKEAAGEQVIIAEARGKRAGLIEKEISEAQLKAAQTALAEEKEQVQKHRLSADLLAALSDKVRAVANTAMEREERALKLIEQEIADRESRVSTREKILGERELKIAKREKEIDTSRYEMQNLVVTLEGSMHEDKEGLKREATRLNREAARMDAMQGAIVSDMQDLRMQTAMERQLLEEAREARRKERESFLDEVSRERRGMAAEKADMQRQLEASRAELLALKSRVIEYEARATSSLQQAIEEESRVGAAQRETEIEMEAVALARATLQEERSALEAEARELVEYAAKLQAQSSEVAQSFAETEAMRVDLAQQRGQAAAEIARLAEQDAKLHNQHTFLEDLKQGLDRERVNLAEERRVVSQERVDAHRAAERSRELQMQLAEAVRNYVAQGVPIPFALQTTPGSGSPYKAVPVGPPAAPTAALKQPDQVATANAKRRPSSTLAGGGRGAAASTGRMPSRNALKRMLDKLGLADTEASGTQPESAAYIDKQREFLHQLRLNSTKGTFGRELVSRALKEASTDRSALMASPRLVATSGVMYTGTSQKKPAYESYDRDSSLQLSSKVGHPHLNPHLNPHLPSDSVVGVAAFGSGTEKDSFNDEASFSIRPVHGQQEEQHPSVIRLHKQEYGQDSASLGSKVSDLPSMVAISSSSSSAGNYPSLSTTSLNTMTTMGAIGEGADGDSRRLTQDPGSTAVKTVAAVSRGVVSSASTFQAPKPEGVKREGGGAADGNLCMSDGHMFEGKINAPLASEESSDWGSETNHSAQIKKATYRDTLEGFAETPSMQRGRLEVQLMQEVNNPDSSIRGHMDATLEDSGSVSNSPSYKSRASSSASLSLLPQNV